MQLVLSNNRIIAHGENFLSLGGVVINTETGTRYDNATIAECEGCPSDIDRVGYEYHSGVFVPCAPFGAGDNNGYFMEICTSCATPRNSGIQIKETMDKVNSSFRRELLWENASPNSEFKAQTITLTSSEYTYLLIEAKGGTITGTDTNTNKGYIAVPNFITFAAQSEARLIVSGYTDDIQNTRLAIAYRDMTINGANISVGKCYSCGHQSIETNSTCVPLRIYGVKL